MHLTKFTASLPLLIALTAIVVSADKLRAQSVTTASWMESASNRLKQIYDQDTFRAAPLQSSWHDGGEHLRVRISSAESNQPEWQWIQTSTGKTVQASGIDNRQDKERLPPNVSPVSKFRFSTDDGKLVVERWMESDGEPIATVQGQGEVRFYGMTWSPDGRHLAFIQSDQNNVRKRSMLVPSDPSYPGIREQIFARVGGTIATLKVGLIDTQSGETSWVELDPVTSNGQQGFYLGQVEWAGNSDELLIEKLSRFRDRRQFFLLNVKTNQIKTIFDETNPAWAISSQGKNLGLMWIQEGSHFIVISEKDGWRHAFLYSREGKELATLTPGDYDIIDRGPIDEASGHFYFYASPDNGTQKHLYRVPLDGSGDRERITPKELGGTNEYDFSPNLKHAIHTHSNIDTPPVQTLISLPDHQAIKVLQENHQVHDALNQWKITPTEFVKIETEPDVSMDALIMKPRGFDASKKYPVLVYVYGEPHGQTVLDQWSAGQSLFHRVITDLGYIVVSIDNRGTPAPKGAAWRRSVFGSLGPLSTEDQAAAIQQLGQTHPFIDLDRIAIWGWSGGGSNTLNALFRKPDLYKVGIAVVPKPQPHLYNAWFQEMYMRTREVNPEGYQRSAPLHFAEGLQGKLLIVTGSGETNTHMQIIEGLVDRLVELGKPFDYMVYPNRNHGLSEGPGSKVHVRMLIARYLMENLPREPR